MRLIDIYLQELFGSKELNVEAADFSYIWSSDWVEDVVSPMSGPESLLNVQVNIALPVQQNKYILLYLKIDDEKNFSPYGDLEFGTLRESIYIPKNKIEDSIKED